MPAVLLDAESAFNICFLSCNSCGSEMWRRWRSLSLNLNPNFSKTDNDESRSEKVNWAA